MVQVNATYLGADAQTIEQSVAAPIEQQMSGVDNMSYMMSTNAQQRLNEPGADLRSEDRPKHRPGLTQMRESLATTQLPADVANYGITMRKASASPLIMFSLYSPKGTRDRNFLANYAYINLVDQFSRVSGVGDVWCSAAAMQCASG